MLEALKMLEMFAHVSSQDHLNDVTSQCSVRHPVSAANKHYIALLLLVKHWHQEINRKAKAHRQQNNDRQGWKGSKRSINNRPNQCSTLETSTSQYVSMQL